MFAEPIAAPLGWNSTYVAHANELKHYSKCSFTRYTLPDIFNKPFISLKVLTHCPLVISHTFIVLSSLQDVISLPSGENLAHRTQFVCPLNDMRNLL